MKSKKKKDNRGGPRPGAGRPPADYETTTVAFRVRVEIADEVKELVKNYVDKRTKELE